MTNVSSGLDCLAVQIMRDLEMLQYPPKSWVSSRTTPCGDPINDVVIIGGGMCGLVVNFALLRAGITNIRTFDLHAKGKEGPWVNYARMETLRSPKNLAGPALGLPNLTFQSWFEAQWGKDTWNALGKIPTATWMDYLIWYRKVLNIDIENESEVLSIVPLEHAFEITIKHNESQKVSLCSQNSIGDRARGNGRAPDPICLAKVPRRLLST